MGPPVLVIIPALNEAASVGGVVEGAVAALDADVVVIDDGSTDPMADRTRAAGPTILGLPYNLGVGGPVRTGLRYPSAHGYERVLQLDGDGHHDPREGKRLIEEIDNGDVDFVVDRRFDAGYQVDRGRRFAIRVLSMNVSRRLGVRVEGTTSGFRALGPKAVELLSSSYSVDYSSDTVEPCCWPPTRVSP